MVIQASFNRRDIFLHPLEVGAKLVLENIYFAFDSDELDLKSNEELNRIVNLLNKYPSINIEISGHTDNVGTQKYNQDLSERRAKKVYDNLIASHIQPSSIKFIGYADSFPIASNSTENGRTRNRRIEIKIVTINGL